MGQILFSAAHKSSGKTIVSTGVCAALKKQNVVVQPFKKGPDYIDPMWLATASKRNCYNLDFWTQSKQEILQLFTSKSASADISIIEANKGLYDGLDLDGSNSNAALAKLLDTSVILVLDCRGTIRGIAPLLLGYQHFDKQVKIEGVILNFVGGSRHEKKLRQVIEHYTDMKILGAIHRNEALTLEERYLGLIPSNEDHLATTKVQEIAKIIADQVDLSSLQEIASPLPKFTSPTIINPKQYNLRIAYAKDSAFGFYYSDDLEKFEQYGVTLIPFDTLQDTDIPKADALFFGGGFPEKCMQSLQNNSQLRKKIKIALANGLPAYAECGGLMYLCNSITYEESKADMVGLIDSDCLMTTKPQGRGYTQFNENTQSIWQQQQSQIHAHEFHYSYLENLPKDSTFAFDISRGKGIQNKQDGLVIQNTLACYSHQRDTQQNPWITRFLDFVESCKTS